MTGDLVGRVAVVTGASSGLGRRAAELLHAQGADVVIAARRLDRLDELADRLGRRVHPTSCDVRSSDDIAATFEVAARLGGADVVVAAAGISDGEPAETESRQRFADVIDVNLVATFEVAATAARQMLPKGRGSIVHIASIFGLVASTPVRAAAYAASKGGLVNLTRELAAQWGDRGVRVNAVAPGWFPTEMNTELFRDERSMAWVERSTMLGRAGADGELDGAIRFLASDDSSYVTGHVLVVDGGWTAR